MKLVYVAGPYGKKTAVNGTTDISGVQENIERARKIAIELWEMGHAVICPHLNTAGFEKDCNLDHAGYLKGDFVIIERCDAIVMTPDWKDSKGATMEYNHAKEVGVSVYVYPEVPDVLV